MVLELVGACWRVPELAHMQVIAPMAEASARAGCEQKLIAQHALQTAFTELQSSMGLPRLPNRIDCFDISHLSGSSTVAGCVVMNTKGFQRPS